MCIMDIMKLSDSESYCAAVLEPRRVQVRPVRKAMQQVTASLSKRGSSSSPVYAVMLYGKRSAHNPNVLSATTAFLSAYKRAMAAVSEYTQVLLTHPDLDHLHSLEMKSFGNVYLYWGRATAEEVKKKIPTDPGIYILVSDLDADLLKDLRLPSVPKALEKVPAVIRVGYPTLAEDVRVLIDVDVKEPFAFPQDELAPAKEAAVGKNTVAWRKRFMDEYRCFTSEEVAQEATSLATNQAALASRWVKERKIFSVPFEGKLRFPEFQFEFGRPIPAVADVMAIFPAQASGWELAYFFVTPNSNIRGHKPVELLKQDPQRLVSLAQAFVHPADVF